MRPALEVTGAWYTGVTWNAWVMTGVHARLDQQRITATGPGPGEVVVEVAGCGVSHADLAFVHHGVPPRHRLPLVLGHEIAGWVRATGAGVDASLVDRPVIVPSMLPCGECEQCRAGRRTICRRQVMPGNDRHGGFASHAVVPARFICPVPDRVLATHDLWELAPVAEAVSTPFQAVRRSGLQAGELAVVIGIGGIGVHAVQIAAALGARVLALDVNPSRLRQALVAGAAAARSVAGLKVKDIRELVHDRAEALGAPSHPWRIFEASGTKAGQEAAFALLGYGGSLAVIGHTQDRVTVALSNVMTYDAEVRGTWSADPQLYPEILSWIGAGRLRLRPFVERHPLARINEVFDAVHQGALVRRAVLVPEPA